ncbi:MAG TPA: PIG-L family deacetylase [Chloroflexota bacterium]|nr:PIG-L family deacetylase [Chloroflexota bacterium]
MPRAPRTPALFVSPHFDDVALSCGGAVALEARDGDAVIVTVFAGDPKGGLNAFARFQHERWGHDDAVDERRREDRKAREILGADYRWLDYPDAIYRGEQYLSDEELFGPVKPGDAELTANVTASLLELAEELSPHRVYLPLTVGGHVDHRICWAAVPALKRQGVRIRFYEDFPYAATSNIVEATVPGLSEHLEPEVVELGDAFDAKLAAIGVYESQLATVFRNLGPWDEVTRRYAASRSEAGGYAERFWVPAVTT